MHEWLYGNDGYYKNFKTIGKEGDFYTAVSTSRFFGASIANYFYKLLQEEKANKYLKAPSGGPLVQHALVAMLDFYNQGKISLTKIAEKMSHAVATCFEIEKRGYIRQGYFADLVLVDLHRPWTVEKNNILYKCGWSPFEGHTFNSSVVSTFVNGNQVFDQGKFDETTMGMRLTFDR